MHTEETGTQSYIMEWTGMDVDKKKKQLKRRISQRKIVSGSFVMLLRHMKQSRLRKIVSRDNPRHIIWKSL